MFRCKDFTTRLFSDIKQLYRPILLCCSFMLHISLQASELTLQEIVTIPGKDGSQWLSPVVIQTKQDNYLLLNSDGRLHYTKQREINSDSLAQLLDKDRFIRFTALTAHPSFNLRDMEGFGTFYTAHIENTIGPNKNKPTVKSLAADFKYNIVVNEWKLKTTKKLNINKQSVRELMRLPVISEKAVVSQLIFDPYVKQWDEEYGHLHITFQSDVNLQKQPLYSGTVLRIEPKKFGAKAYNIPKSNPFTKMAKINNEIIVLGVNQIEKIIWQKNQKNGFIILEGIDGVNVLTKASYGENWLSTPRPKALKSSAQPLANIVFYSGREIKAAKSKNVALTQLAGRLTINEVSSQPFGKTNELANIALQDTKLSDQLSLLTNGKNELIIFDKINVSFFAVKAKQAEAAVKKDSEEELQNSSISTPLIISILVVVSLLLVLLAIKFNRILKKRIPKGLLHKKYSRFETAIDQQELQLYLRHEQNIDRCIKFDEIEQSELLLNDKVISSINFAQQQIFGKDKETELRAAFSLEKREKMIDEKVRKLDLVLSLKDEEKVLICFYLRKGNHRLTKPSFKDSIEKSIYWLWAFSHYIDPINISKPEPLIEGSDKITLKHNVLTPDITQNKADYIQQPEQLRENCIDKASEIEHTKELVEEEVEDSNISITTRDTEKVDIEIISALEKLSILKQQGHLSEDEFNSAKAKLLQDLIK